MLAMESRLKQTGEKTLGLHINCARIMTLSRTGDIENPDCLRVDPFVERLNFRLPLKVYF
jgi:hypothetical protein